MTQLKMKESMAQIHNFGQTPTQLFKSPHPRREIKRVHYLMSQSGGRQCDGTDTCQTPIMPGVYPPRIKLEAVEIMEETVLQKASKAIDTYLTNNVNLAL